MVDVTVTGVNVIEKDLKALSEYMPIPKKHLNALAELWKDAIKQRTLKGEDADGNKFEPYSSVYRLRRAKAGRSTNPVNLFWRGHMLAAMTHRAEENYIRVYFRTVKEGLKAHGHHYGSAKTGLPSRPFFSLNDDDIAEAVAYLEKNYGLKL